MRGMNPFEDDSREYLVLVNAEGQHSLWPASDDVPQGWTAAHRGERGGCLEYVERHWCDMRPASLVAQSPDAG